MDISLNLELSNYSSELLNFKMVWLVLNAILIILIIIFSYFGNKLLIYIYIYIYICFIIY